MGALTPTGLSATRQVSLLHVHVLPIIPSPTTWRSPVVALARYPSARQASRTGLDFATCQQARQHRPAESSSSSYGLIIRLPLLSTWPRGHAVTFDYRPENVCLEGTFTLLYRVRSQAHWHGRLAHASHGHLGRASAFFPGPGWPWDARAGCPCHEKRPFSAGSMREGGIEVESAQELRRETSNEREARRPSLATLGIRPRPSRCRCRPARRPPAPCRR